MSLFLHIFIIVCIFIIGSLFGSFFSLATYRLPRHQDIVATRSYCPNCKHRLNFLDLFPVLSYLWCGAKCRYCKQKISIRYFLLEAINGFIFVGMYFLFGYTITFMFVALIYAILFVLIGSQIMESKMSEEEKAEVKDMVEKKKELKLNKKQGVFISELVIALLFFVILITTAFMMNRNYKAKSVETIARGQAIELAVKNAEMALGTDYDMLSSFETSEVVDNITYTTSVIVTKYADQDFTKEDIVKKIQVIVRYPVQGKQNEFSFETLKGKVI